MPGPIPTQEEMQQFQSKLHQLGLEGVENNLIKKVYAHKSWKEEMAKKYLANIKEEQDKTHNNKSLNIAGKNFYIGVTMVILTAASIIAVFFKEFIYKLLGM